MKTFITALLLTSGVLLAQEQPAQPTQAHLSETQRIALRTQSPPVKTHSSKHSNKPADYVVKENRSTIIAIKPFETQR
jgi:hypothetical protein